MKSKKREKRGLELNKFTVVKFDNLHKIVGGDPGTDTKVLSRDCEGED